MCMGCIIMYRKGANRVNHVLRACTCKMENIMIIVERRKQIAKGNGKDSPRKVRGKTAKKIE